MGGHDSNTIAAIADRLRKAELDRVPIPPITDEREDLDVQDAYAIQAYNVERRISAGAVVRGRKVGLTSRAQQELVGVSEPDFGVLLDDMFVEDGDEILLDRLVQPRVEAEIALRLGTDLAGPGITTTDALGCVDGALPAIEIVDSCIADWRIQLVDTIADNASSGRVVLGSRITPPRELDLRLLGMLFYRNGVPIDSGAGAAALGHPARVVAWLANMLGALGSGLRRGDIVLSGALHRMVPVRSGDVIHAQFAHLGAVTTRFGGSGGGT